MLLLSDYTRTIQPTQLAQLTGGNDALRLQAEATAQEEATEYLSQKYDIAQVLTPTTLYDATKTYTAQHRVYTTTNGIDTIYHPTLPAPLFDSTATYVVGDTIYYQGHQYTCKAATLTIDPTQYSTYATIPTPNLIPGIAGAACQWQDNGAYTIPAGGLANPTYWTPGDNRNPRLVMVLIDIALYYLHQRISPNNIPALRTKAYQGDAAEAITKDGHTTYPPYSALGWLQAATRGELTASLPPLQPKQATRIRFGGSVKTDNSY